MRHQPAHGRRQDHGDQHFVSGFEHVHLQFHGWGSRSQNQKPSRQTVSPREKPTGSANSGPSNTKVWNSPFSPQGSTSAGSSSRNRSSMIRPAKRGSSL